ncbi:hypothetical protein Pfo_017847 [Paulownia fortunei]|nr:hypothetical protein Pfo_017847 [Paulownia fortunei]
MEQQDKQNCQEPIMEDETAGSEAPPGFSTNGRILVKLKLPKMPGEEEEEKGQAEAEVEIGPAEEIKSHYCKECDKSFSSGKALGGHMSSAHVQANKDHSLKKLKSKMKRQHKSAGSSSGSSGENMCTVCAKCFPSRKSLFGHMRCHPEREWRGMEPPAEPKIESSEASWEPGLENVGLNQEGHDDDDQIDSDPDVVAPTADVGNTLKGWPMTAKRVRWQTKPANDSPPVSSSEEKEELVAGHQLLKLLERGSGKQNFGEVEDISSNSLDDGDHFKKQKRDSCEAIQGPELETADEACEFKKQKRDSSVQKLKICEREAIDDRRKIGNNGKGKEKIDDKGKGKAVVSEPGKTVRTSCLPDAIDSEGELYATAIAVLTNGKLECRMYSQKKVEEKIMPADSKATAAPAAELSPVKQKSDSETSIPEKYICSTCNRSFPTHQALGGHRSSHNKFKLSVVNTMDQRPNAAVIQEKPNAEIVTNNVGANSASEQQSGIPVDDANAHLCKICNKTFPTGQALGGHKRCHSTAEENNKTAPKFSLDIDLNKTPDWDNDESGVQSMDAAGDPSSHTSNF